MSRAAHVVGPDSRFLSVGGGDKSWPRGASLSQLAVDGLWIIFFIIASSAGYASGVENTERFVWFPADLAVLVLLLLRHEEFLTLLRKNALFVSWPVLACVSAIWSFAPGVSLYHGVQLLLTIMVAFMLLMYADLRRIQQLLFVALLICAGLSIAITVLRPDTAYSLAGEWKGAYPAKNVLGGVMAILVVTGICLFLQGWRPLFTLAGTIVGAILLASSHAGTSIIAIAITLAVLPLVFSFRKGPITFSLVVGFAIIVLAGAFLTFELMDIDPVQSGLTGMGKDETLTGRTIIWDIGVDAYESRPWLGFGYKGYWEGEGTTAPYLRFVVGDDLWYFHNVFIEVAVAFGFIGPLVLGLGLIVGLYLAVRAFVLDRQAARLWPILIIIQIFALCFAENPLFSNHSIYQLLIVVAVGSATYGAVPGQKSN